MQVNSNAPRITVQLPISDDTISEYLKTTRAKRRASEPRVRSFFGSIQDALTWRRSAEKSESQAPSLSGSPAAWIKKGSPSSLSSTSRKLTSSKVDRRRRHRKSSSPIEDPSTVSFDGGSTCVAVDDENGSRDCDVGSARLRRASDDDGAKKKLPKRNSAGSDDPRLDLTAYRLQIGAEEEAAGGGGCSGSGSDTDDCRTSYDLVSTDDGSLDLATPPTSPFSLQCLQDVVAFHESLPIRSSTSCRCEMSGAEDNRPTNSRPSNWEKLNLSYEMALHNETTAKSHRMSSSDPPFEPLNDRDPDNDDLLNQVRQNVVQSSPKQKRKFSLFPKFHKDPSSSSSNSSKDDRHQSFSTSGGGGATNIAASSSSEKKKKNARENKSDVSSSSRRRRPIKTSQQQQQQESNYSSWGDSTLQSEHLRPAAVLDKHRLSLIVEDKASIPSSSAAAVVFRTASRHHEKTSASGHQNHDHQPNCETSKPKDKNVLRSFFGRIRSKSISYDKKWTLNDHDDDDEEDGSAAAASAASAAQESMTTKPSRGGVRPSFSRSTSVEESPTRSGPERPPRRSRESRQTARLSWPKRSQSVSALDRPSTADGRGSDLPHPTAAPESPGPYKEKLPFFSSFAKSQSQKNVYSSMPDLRPVDSSRQPPAGYYSIPPPSPAGADRFLLGKEKKEKSEDWPPSEKKVESEKRRILHSKEPELSSDEKSRSKEINVNPIDVALKRGRRSTIAEIAVSVFNRKTPSNHGKSILKLLDTKKDIQSRLKHLRLISENYDDNKLKQFYCENFSCVYYLFHESFTTAETSLSSKASRAQKEDLDLIFLLEKIICLLPELINKRWQCHSIGRIMHKLLQSNLHCRDGMRLFIQWYAVLMDNATNECDLIFRNLIPLSEKGYDAKQMNMIANQLEWMLKFIVTEVSKVIWTGQEASFEFLFRKFYEFYILRIFPGFGPADIYDASVDLSGISNHLTNLNHHHHHHHHLILQEVIIRWITEFAQSSRSGLPAEMISFGIVPERVTKEKPDQLLPGIHTPSSDVPRIYSVRQHEIVCAVLYSSRDSVNILIEILHRAFLMSVDQSRITKRVISVYKHWFQSQTKPRFLDEPVDPQTPQINSAEKTNSAVLPDVGLGLQRGLQVFVAQSRVIFMQDWKRLDQKFLEVQVELCKRTLSVYRYIATNVFMSRQTWTHLLTVLLQITSHVLDSTTPKLKKRSLAGELASTLLQTLIVTWIRANMNIVVSKDLWNQLASVLSGLTEWPEVIQEWAQAMEVLTSILADVVYDVDVKNLSDRTDNKRRFIKNRKDLLDVETSGARFSSGETAKGREAVSLTPLRKRRQNTVIANQRMSTPLPLLKITHSASFNQNLPRSSSDGDVSSSIESQKGYPNRLFTNHHDLLKPHSLESLTSDRRRNATRSAKASTPLVTRRRNDSRSTGAGGSPVADAASAAGDEPGCRRSTEFDCCSAPDTDRTRFVSSSVGSDDYSDGALSCNSSSAQNGHRSHGIGVGVRSQGSSNADSDVDNRGVTKEELREMMGSYFNEDMRERTVPLATVESLSSILEDGASEVSTDGFASDGHTTCSSEMMPDSAGSVFSGAVAYESPLLDAEPKYFLPSSESSGVAEDSPSFAKATDHHPLRNSADMSPAFLERDLEFQEDSAEDSDVSSLTLKCGTVGWTPEVAEVIWRRILGLLGDVNSIEDADSHAMVFDCLRCLTETLIKVHNAVSLNVVQQKAPPILVIAPWIFQALTLPDKYLRGKVSAYRLLCTITLQPFMELPKNHLLRFFLVLHRGLVHSNLDIVNVLIQCASKFFVMPLEGATILLLDFIHAATGIVTVSTGQTRAPTFEAISLLGSLICFPNHFGQISALMPDVEDITLTDVSETYLKNCIINVLLSSASNDTLQLTNCVRISCLGIYVYEELSHRSMHSKIRDAIVAILTSIEESTDPIVRQTSLEVLTLLTDHVETLLTEFPQLPGLIIEELIYFVESSLVSIQKSSVPASDFKTVTSSLFCLLEWSMKTPIAVLLDSFSPSDRKRNQCLLERIFNALQLDGKSSSSVPNDDLTVDHNSNYQTFPATTASSRTSADLSSSSVQVAQQDDKKTLSVQDLKAKNDQSPRNADVKVTAWLKLGLVAQAAKMHLLNYLGHYPMGLNGACKVDSHVLECHDLSDLEQDALNNDILNRSDVQFLVWNECVLISLNELPLEPASSTMDLLSTGSCRIIVRDMNGKHCSDLMSLFVPSDQSYRVLENVCSLQNMNLDDDEVDLDIFNENGIRTIDLIDSILEEISIASPECCLNSGRFLNCTFLLPSLLPAVLDDLAPRVIAEQDRLENDYLSAVAVHHDRRFRAHPSSHTQLTQDANWPFHACKQFLNRMGYLNSEKRNCVDLLKKSEQLIRDLRHLDSLICRETHKIAVIYVAGGQEDKASILSNERGSCSYEEFISGLGWKVSLESHEGYMGGLQRNKTNGEIGVYYSTSTVEIMFHVSTVMPSDVDGHQKKVRHLGNDEVHIIWSDHYRRYHRNIINTEFADVIIVIYPMSTGLFHIQILKKPGVGIFGPLFDGAIVGSLILAGLVRATALNASRKIRANKQHYQTYYEERDSYVKNILDRHKESAAREDFIAEVFSPGMRLKATDNFIPIQRVKAVQMTNSPSQPTTKGRNHKNQ